MMLPEEGQIKDLTCLRVIINQEVVVVALIAEPGREGWEKCRKEWKSEETTVII